MFQVQLSFSFSFYTGYKEGHMALVDYSRIDHLSPPSYPLALYKLEPDGDEVEALPGQTLSQLMR